MATFKQIVLYVLGVGLLVFGSRKDITNAAESYYKKHPKDENKDVEKEFETQTLSLDTIKSELKNDHLYFQTLHVNINALNSKKRKRSDITIESKNAETATDSM